MKKNQYATEEDRAKQIEAVFQKLIIPEKKPTKVFPIEWCPDIHLFKIHDALHQFFGDQKVGFEVNKQWYLYPEEAIFLYYKGKVKAKDAEKTEEEAALDGVGLMKMVYNNNGNQEDKYQRMYIYRCYEFFRRNSFHIRRYTQFLDIGNLKEGDEEIVKKIKEDKEDVTKRIFNERPVFKVYETNQAYYNDQVSFYLIIVSFDDESFDIEMLGKLKETFQKGKSQLKVALVDEDEIVVYELGSLFDKKR